MHDFESIIKTPMFRLAYSVDETAALLSCSRRTVYNEIKSGRLRSFKSRNRRLVSRRALESYIDKREFEAN